MNISYNPAPRAHRRVLLRRDRHGEAGPRSPMWNVRPLEDRFWSRVLKSSGCWEWGGGRSSRGYGAILVGGKQMGAHRVSWKIHFGSIPKGLWVLHKCDNPPCVRPDHLFLGDASSNAKDAFEKGRRVSPPCDRRGIHNAAAKISSGDVVMIRRLYANGLTQAEIAKRFGLRSITSVSNILRGRTWAHI